MGSIQFPYLYQGRANVGNVVLLLWDSGWQSRVCRWAAKISSENVETKKYTKKLNQNIRISMGKSKVLEMRGGTWWRSW